MKTTPLAIRILLLFTIVSLAAAAAVYGYARLPSVQTQLATRSAGAAVTILKPASNLTWYLNSAITVVASAAGVNPVKSLELLADGVPVPFAQAQSGGYGTWTWRLVTSGEHTLLVRATDSAGAVTTSNAVRVVGLTGSLPGMQVVYPVQPGDTAESIAGHFQVSLDLLKQANPQANLDAPLPAGTSLKVPIVFDQSAPPDGVPLPAGSSAIAPPGSTAVPNKLVVWGSQFIEQDPPGAPTVIASVKDCNVSLQVNGASSGELGFNIYRLDPGASSFHKVGSLVPFADASLPVGYFDPTLYGLFSYTVSAYNGKGQTPGNIVAVDVSAASCQNNTWSGSQGSGDETGPVDPGIFQTKSAEYDKAYYYLSINGSVKQRVPSDPNAFLDLPNNLFNVNDQFALIAASQPQGALAVEMDAWGWRSGSLLHIGDYLRTISGTQAPPTLDTTGLLEICSQSQCDSSGLTGAYTDHADTYGYGNWPFRWKPNDSQVTSGLVQVSVVPFEQSCDASPAGLALSTIIQSTGKINLFSVDFAPLQSIVLFVNGWYYDSPQQFYIRILPQVNGQTACPASTSVSWKEHLLPPAAATATPKPSAPAPSNPYSIAITNFQPIQQPDVALMNCVKVIANPYTGTNPASLQLMGYDKIWVDPAAGPGGTVCPAPHSGGYTPPETSFFDQLGSLVSGAINGITEAYNAIKGFLVKLTDELNPVCAQAKFMAGVANQGQSAVNKVCGMMAEATVDAGLALVGLPPSLPNFNDVTNLSKGYLVEEAAKQFEDQTGIPCDQECQDLISSGLDATISQITTSQNNSACVDKVTAEDDGYEPLCNPPGVQTVPDSRGQLLPAFASLTITRDPNATNPFPDPSLYTTKCYWQFGVSGKNNSWIGQTFAIGDDPSQKKNPMIFWQGAELDGTLFHSYNQQIPNLAPGESLTIPLTLTPLSYDYPSKSGFWIDQHYLLVQTEQQYSQLVVHSTDDWTLLYDGALITANARTFCSTSGSGLITGHSPDNTATLQTQLAPTH